MKVAEIEWSILRGALIGLAVTLMVAGGLMGASYYFWETKDTAFKRADRERRAAEKEYRELDELAQMVAKYYPIFRDLEREGIIGEERRLKWTDALKEADRALKLPSVAYSINRRERHKVEFPIVDGAYKLYASEMNLRLGLLHGEDLFSLLGKLEEELEEKAGGLFSVDHCTVARRRDAPGTGQESHLMSTCRLYWYTIQKPGERGS